MIPPHLSKEVKSGAEKQIFELFKNDPKCADFTILHSLGLARHVKRQFGEIDFVVLAPDMGVFCLEVKGGRVKRQAGVWTFTDRYGQTNSKRYSPFTQAREGMFSLLGAVGAKFGTNNKLYNLVFRYGVMFPDIEFTQEEPEFERWEIFDLRDKLFPIGRYIEKLSKQAHKQVEGTKWYNPKASRPTQEDIRLLVQYLRGDFEKIPPPITQFNEIENNLLALTSKQYDCLDALESNEMV